ncbi:MAG: transcriptional regulator [Planctomycetota bacterium]|nr:MAG: transcriptional regulator [Planctomycetota bacterium]
MNTQGHKEAILGLAARQGLVRPKDLERAGIPRVYLRRLVDDGLLTKLGRGLYALPSYAPSELATIAEAAKKAPTAIVCLLSALRIHGLTTQNPFEVWIMIDRDAWRPKLDYPPLRVVRASGDSLAAGVTEMRIDGVDARVTCPAKTVADCFKHRTKVGVDVAVEALRDCWKQRAATLDEIGRYAEIDRVAKVMRPYMEALQ